MHRIGALTRQFGDRIGQAVDGIDIIAGAADQLIGAQPAVHAVIAVAADQRVRVVAAEQRVIAVATIQTVIAAQTRQDVVARIADHLVLDRVAGAADRGAAGHRQVLDIGAHHH